jgi:hypothetical protein
VSKAADTWEEPVALVKSSAVVIGWGELLETT